MAVREWRLVSGERKSSLFLFLRAPCPCLALTPSPLAIHLVAQGLVDLKPLLTHTFKFGDALEAFEITKAGKDKEGKFVIKCVIDGPEDDFELETVG